MVRGLYRGAAVVLITFAVLPFTAPFSTCGLAALVAAPMAIDSREHAAPTTMSAADPAQVVSSCNEAFKDDVLTTGVSHTPTMRGVRNAVRAAAFRTSGMSLVSFVLRL